MKKLMAYLPARRDVITAALFGVLYVVSTQYLRHHGWRPGDIRWYQIAALFCGLVLLLRNRYPMSSLLVAALIYPVYYGHDIYYDKSALAQLQVVPILLAAYAVANKGQIRAIVIGIVASIGVITLCTTVPNWAGDLLDPVRLRGDVLSWDLSTLALAEAATLAVILLGRAAYKQRRATAQLMARHREIERLRRIETDQIVMAERTRIARELHDVVAHHISAVVIRAQAADRVAADRPEETREAVRWIAASGQDTLAAMRHVVRVLRSTGTGSSLTPQATLAELPAMAGRLREVGLDVTLNLPVAAPALSAAVELAAVRIVQEALTNVLVHAHATRAIVDVRLTDDGLVLDIHDDGTVSAPPTQPIEVITEDTKLPARSGGRPASARASQIVSGQPNGGNGLVGMRERAASLGGWLAIGTSPLGGWQISALLRTSLTAGHPSAVDVRPADDVQQAS